MARLHPISPHFVLVKRFAFAAVVLLASAATARIANAHTVGESYIWVNVEEDCFSGRVELNLDDLREKLGLPVPESGEERLAFLREHRDEAIQYIRAHFYLESEGERLPLEFSEISVLDLPGEEGIYAQYAYRTSAGPVPDSILIHGSLCFENDITHRTLLCMERNSKAEAEVPDEFVAMVLGPHKQEHRIDLTNIESLLRPRDFIWQGVLHIWIGTDHILFIITLLLPAVLIYQEAKWNPVPGFSSAFWNIVKIVSLFTIAHSITLSLTAVGLVDLPSRVVESIIALSIILVAINAIWPKFQDRNWMVIFGFGLFHGMGFASVMAELPFRMLNLMKVLIGFNIGVELGQLAIVMAVFPVIFLLRKSSTYVPFILKGGSLATAAVACIWFVERAFNL